MLNSQTESPSCPIIPLRSSCNPHSLLFIHRSQQLHPTSIALHMPSHVVVRPTIRSSFDPPSLLIHHSFTTTSHLIPAECCFVHMQALRRLYQVTPLCALIRLSFNPHSLITHPSFTTTSHLLPAEACVVHLQALRRLC